MCIAQEDDVRLDFLKYNCRFLEIRIAGRSCSDQRWANRGYDRPFTQLLR